MDKTIELVNTIKDIQAMPSVIVRTLNLMKKPTVSMKELGDIVMYDQSLTIKILALVNSAYYGFSQQISSISIALSLLGMVKVKNIIVAVAMKPMMSNAGDKELWKHSIRVAAGCEYLAKLTKVMDADEAFIAGFIHDVGKIVLHTSNPKMYSKVIDIVNNEEAFILDVEKHYSDSLKYLGACYFKISYNDGNVKNVFTVECDLKNTTAYGFLKNTPFMDDDQLEILVEKIHNNVFNVVDSSKEYNIESISNDLYNEALIFVTSGINKEECKSIKNDFETKFENYITVQNCENDKIICMMEDLYNKIIEIKTK